MDGIEFKDSDFRTSSLSGGDAGTCVEVACREDIVAVRNSLRPGAGTVLFTAAEWKAFIGGVKLGEFDLG
jgi:hypothetical protein